MSVTAGSEGLLKQFVNVCNVWLTLCGVSDKNSHLSNIRVNYDWKQSCRKN